MEIHSHQFHYDPIYCKFKYIDIYIYRQWNAFDGRSNNVVTNSFFCMCTNSCIRIVDDAMFPLSEDRDRGTLCQPLLPIFVWMM